MAKRTGEFHFRAILQYCVDWINNVVRGVKDMPPTPRYLTYYPTLAMARIMYFNGITFELRPSPSHPQTTPTYKRT